MVKSQVVGRLTQVCGLRVTGPLAPMGRTAYGPADLVMEAGHVAYPRGSQSMEGLEPNAQGVTVGWMGDDFFIRFHDLADAVLDMKAGTATVGLSASAPPGMDEVLAAGPVLALALALRGQPCLHASAVARRGRAVAFAAPSGGGKSTLAALACLGGLELVADDILALAVTGSEVRCLAGSRELRLRPATAELLADAAWPRRTTADARVAVLAGSDELAHPRLAAIVMPMITGDAPTAIEPLGAAAATRALLACARVVSLQTSEHARTMLELAAALSAHVPVYRVTMPALGRAALPQAVVTVLEEHLGSGR